MRKLTKAQRSARNSHFERQKSLGLWPRPPAPPGWPDIPKGGRIADLPEDEKARIMAMMRANTGTALEALQRLAMALDHARAQKKGGGHQ